MGWVSPDPWWGAMAWLNLVRVTQKPERPEATLSGLLQQGQIKKEREEMGKKDKESEGPWVPS